MRGTRLCSALIVSCLLVACSESATGPTDLPFDLAPAFGHVSGGTSPLPVIDEHFDNGSLTPGLEYSPTEYEITGGKIKRIAGSSTADEDREYVQTEAGGYLDEDFTAVVTFTLDEPGSSIGATGGFIHYFGLGPTPPDPTYFDEGSGFYFRIHGTAKASGLVHAAFRPTGDGGAFADWLVSFPNRLGAGTHRARIVKAGNVLSFSIDENNDGSWWTAIEKDVTTVPAFLTSSNSHIYFGTGSDVDTFDDLSVVLLDTDGDGVPDNVDNCPADANSDQADADNNGVGNACQTVYTSGTHIDTWKPIFPLPAELGYPAWKARCTTVPGVGLDAGWIPNGKAFDVGPATFQGFTEVTFTATWINAWNSLWSVDAPGRTTAPPEPRPEGHTWTRYSTAVYGHGDFVLNLVADNCSWIFLDGGPDQGGTLVGVQGARPQQFGVRGDLVG